MQSSQSTSRLNNNKNFTVKNREFYSLFSVSINLSARWQTAKKEGRFDDLTLVGVRGYGRAANRQKQYLQAFYGMAKNVFITNRKEAAKPHKVIFLRSGDFFDGLNREFYSLFLLFILFFWIWNPCLKK